MESVEQKFYEDLTRSEKLKLRREFNGFSRSIVWFIVYFLAYILMTAGMVLFMIFLLSPNRRHWHLSGITMTHVGTFILFTMMQMMTSKQNFLKVLGSKKRIVLFFVALAVSIIGNVFVLVYVFTKSQEAWLYWVSIITSNLGLLLFLIPCIKSPPKDMETVKKEEEKFFVWLETEKNIMTGINRAGKP